MPLGAPQQRAALAVLLLADGKPVPVEKLVDALWGEVPPASAVNSVRIYIHRLRRLLADPESAAPAIDSVGSGYRIRTSPEALDLTVFRRLHADARQARGTGNAASAAAELRKGLALWHGPALADLTGAWAETQRAQLDGLRVSALETCLAADVDGESHQGAVADLTQLVAEHPLDERFRELLMLALYREGRQAAALDVFDEGRALLVDQLGVDPGPTLQTLRDRILRADPALLPSPASADSAEISGGPADAHTMPMLTQLPNDLPAFAGRESELAQVGALVPGTSSSSPTSSVILTIAGTAGVGKTAFAVHAAHRNASQFPDGQLYLDLRGFDSPGSVVTTSQALCTALEGLGVASDKLPQNVDAQAALYRSLLAGRQVLLLLDNARDSEQVRPLLPGTPGCLAIVTSRNQLSGLIVKDGAHHLHLASLSMAESRDLLARRVGTARIEAEPEAVEEIIERSARLPLALAIIAARAATRTRFPLSVIADELRDTAQPLDAFSNTDANLDVRSVFSWSYHALSGDVARVFRLIALHPGPDISLTAAAALTGHSRGRARQLLTELTATHLIDEQLPGRYAPHNLLRIYATELLHAAETVDERGAATHRMLTHYLHTSYSAAQRLSAKLPALNLSQAPSDALPEAITDYQRALAWFGAEHAVMLALIRGPENAEFAAQRWQLAWCLMEYLQLSGHWEEQIDTQMIALDTARRAGDREGQAHLHRNLARAYAQTSRPDDARAHLQRSLEQFHELGDGVNQARVYNSLAFASLREGEHSQALLHVENAMALAEQAGDRSVLAGTANNIGWIHAQMGAYEEALTYCRRALAIKQELGDPHQTQTWDSIGFIHHQLGDYREAVRCYRTAIAMARELGDTHNEADTLVHMGSSYLADGDRGAARQAWRDALAILDQIDRAAAARIRADLEQLGDSL